MLGGAGIAAASSAQSRRAGTGVERGVIGLKGGGTGDGSRETVTAGVGSGQGVEAGVDGVVSDVAGVWDTGGGETACFGGFCGRLGGRDGDWGCSEGSGAVCRRSRAAVHKPEWGRAGDWAVVDKHVDGDVTVALRVLGCSTRGTGASWGELGAVDGFPDLRLRLRGERCRPVA
jgi:hypothetical protein